LVSIIRQLSSILYSSALGTLIRLLDGAADVVVVLEEVRGGLEFVFFEATTAAKVGHTLTRSREHLIICAEIKTLD
jgi:hypothetical protein